jgi:lipopolysaccharide/colanic/teichoic acid biosynthesis glycosyltransferase
MLAREVAPPVSAPHWAPDPVWKRLLDLVGGAVGTLFGAPFVLVLSLAIWVQDRSNPFYVSTRVGRGGRSFRFVKMRTMIPNAAATRVDTTVAGDPRLLRLGQLVRALKFDELPQFWHVLGGSMSLVGPRPNVEREVCLYSAEERQMLAVRPGITDYASIVFSDLATVLAGCADANIAYNQLVRPWKSALALHYVAHRTLARDLTILMCTAAHAFSRRIALTWIAADLARSGAAPELVRFALRREPLTPRPPPGALRVVTSRDEPGP